MTLNSAKYYQIKQHHMKALLFQQNLQKKEGNIFLAEAFGKAISEVVYSWEKFLSIIFFSFKYIKK